MRSISVVAIAVEEVLRSCRAGAWARFGAGGTADRIQHRPARLGIGHRLDGHEANGSHAVTGQNDLIARLGPGAPIR